MHFDIYSDQVDSDRCLRNYFWLVLCLTYLQHSSLFTSCGVCTWTFLVHCGFIPFLLLFLALPCNYPSLHCCSHVASII